MQEWDKLHKAICKRRQGKTNSAKLAGKDLHFWSQFHLRKDSEKLDELMECVLLDARQSLKMTWEDESYMRTGFKMLLSVIEGCYIEEKTVIENEKAKVDKINKKDRLKPYI